MQLLLFFFSFTSLILPGKKKADVEKYRSYPKPGDISLEFDKRLNVTTGLKISGADEERKALLEELENR